MTTKRAPSQGASAPNDLDTGSMTDSAESLQEAAGALAGKVSGTAQMEIGTRADSQLSKAGDVLGQVAGAIRQGGEQLRTDQPQAASLADTAAGQVEQVSAFLHDTDLNGLMRGAEDFARRQPALFLGGALLLGLAASRFLKASPPDGSRHEGTSREFGTYDTPYGRAGNGHGGYGRA